MSDIASNTSTQQPIDWGQRLLSALISNELISSDEATRVAEIATQRMAPISVILSDSGLLSTKSCLSTLSQISGVKVVELDINPPSTEAATILPPGVARRFGAIGYAIDSKNDLSVVASTPLGEDQIAKISLLAGRDVSTVYIADPMQISQIITRIERDNYSGAFIPPTDTINPTAGQATKAETAPVTNGSEDRMTVSQLARIGKEESSASGNTAAAPTEDPTRKDASKPKHPDIDQLLTYAVANKASDLHLAVGLPPAIRINGSIRKIDQLPVLDNDSLREMIYSILPQSIREKFEETKELDTSYAVKDVGRFRVNVMQQRGSIGAVLRMIPHEIPAFPTLGLPDVIKTFAELRHGLILVTGPTGSGKSTTLASLIDIINMSRPLHIVSVEDPIEFLHTSKRAIVNQREVGVDTYSFSESLKHVLRQDPDVILVGEMRDLETISTALTAAETGHLVFATLHTQDAPQTIDRIIDVFPTNQQDQIRVQLAGTLEAVVTQQLVLNASGTARLPIAEVMVCTAGIRNLIRTAKTHQIYSLMQTGQSYGMQTMDQALAGAVRAGTITEAHAFDRCRNQNELRDHLNTL
jgi:twitching motility protein PilT